MEAIRFGSAFHRLFPAGPAVRMQQNYCAVAHFDLVLRLGCPGNDTGRAERRSVPIALAVFGRSVTVYEESTGRGLTTGLFALLLLYVFSEF